MVDQFSSLAVLLGTVVIFVIRALLLRYRYRSTYRFPAEIPGWPIIGNSLDVPFPGGVWGHQMAKQYGEMYVLNYHRVVERA